MVVAAFAAGDGDGGDERAASAPTPTSAATRDGLAVWVANGCGSCHTFRPANARAMFGPDLAATLQGMPASYIRESIVNPRAAAAAGWEGGIMPEDFAQRIPPAELERLVEFIHAGVQD
jgi:mono/diheme cytochrome c family protein